MGSYRASEQTCEALIEIDSEYRELAERLEQLRAESRAAHVARTDPPKEPERTAEQERRAMRQFSTEVDRMMLRRVQATLFWRFWRWWP
jgi:hypothetical protein